MSYNNFLMAKTCYPTTLKFDDGSVRVVNHQCEGSTPVNPNVATSLKRLTPQGTVDVPVTYNSAAMHYEVTHSSNSQFVLINDFLVTGNEVLFFTGGIEYRWFDDGVNGVHWIYVTKQG